MGGCSDVEWTGNVGWSDGWRHIQGDDGKTPQLSWTGVVQTWILAAIRWRSHAGLTPCADGVNLSNAAAGG